MRLLIAAMAVAAMFLAAPAAEACSCICDNSKQPRNGIERREQERQTLLNFDYVFLGEVVAVGEALPLPADAHPFAIPLHTITIRAVKIAKGPAADTITVLARLGDGGNCFNELEVGDLFRGLAHREGDNWVATNSNCDCSNWAIFYKGGRLDDRDLRKRLYGCAGQRDVRNLPVGLPMPLG
jgi:hypothetical protein